MYKVLMCTAGVGSRAAKFSLGMNKTLLSIAGRPIFSHILDKFPSDIEIVVVLGYQAELVKESLIALYPSRKFEFVYVDKYEGEGTGLGLSILAAKKHLQCPFIFTPNDCFPEFLPNQINPNIIGNWILGVSEKAVPNEIQKEYRGLSQDNGFLDQLFKKGFSANQFYTGLCGIKDFNSFWNIMNEEEDLTIGESAAIRELPEVTVFETDTWYDIGNEQAMNIAKEKLETDSDIHILPKCDESIWFYNDYVYKLFVDNRIVEKRIERKISLPDGLFPKINYTGKYIYSYEKFSGEVLSNFKSVNKILEVLDITKTQMWDEVTSLDNEEKYRIINSFYKNKTLERFEMFCKSREYTDKRSHINGVDVPSFKDLFEKIDWAIISNDAVFAKFHGDFHWENILVNEDTGKYCFLDWRQDFESSTEIGDVYYDLAKFMHGLIVSHDCVVKDEFIIHDDSNGIQIDIKQGLARRIQINTFEKWLDENGFSVRNVKILTALIFVNIAPLHHAPYDLFLFQLGRYLLNEVLALDKQEVFISGF